MKSNLLHLYLMGCLLASLFYSCQSPDQDQEINREVTNDLVESDVNPNGDSELALLMRLMYDQSDSLKQRILNGENLPSKELIHKFQEIHSAVPTDPDVHGDVFTSFSKHLISDLNQFWDLDTGKVAGFNQVVKSCIDCHTVLCPGPISRIEKLKIPQ